jgi:hypothetical protein
VRHPNGVAPRRRRTTRGVSDRASTLTVAAVLDAVSSAEEAVELGAQILRGCHRPDSTSSAASAGSLTSTGDGVLVWTGWFGAALFVEHCWNAHPRVAGCAVQDAFVTQSLPGERAAERMRGLDGAPLIDCNEPDGSERSLFTCMNLSGAGVGIALADTGLDVSGHGGSVQLEIWNPSNAACGSTSRRNSTRYVAYGCQSGPCAFESDHAPSSSNDHGTAVVSIARASAPGSYLSVIDLNHADFDAPEDIVLPPNFGDSLLLRARDCHQATVFSFSWGGEPTGVYSVADRIVDSASFARDDVLVVASAGNDGRGLARSPCVAKNALCVGSVAATVDFFEDSHISPLDYWGYDGPPFESPADTEQRDPGAHRDFYGMTETARPASMFSSSGGTSSGQTKPDCAAVGQYVLSSTAGGGTLALQGTSMATPVIAGAMAQMSELVRRLSWLSTPRLRSCGDGCEWTLITQAEAGGVAAAAAAAAEFTAHSSLLRAMAHASTAACNSLFGFERVSSFPAAYRPARMTGTEYSERARKTCGSGELSLGRYLAPTATRSTFLLGENELRGFRFLAVGGRWVNERAPASVLAAELFMQAGPERSFCFSTNSDGAEFRASLAWRDAPSIIGMTTIAESRLFLSVVVGGAERGDPSESADTSRIVVLPPLPRNTLIKVSVAAMRITARLSGLDKQLFALVASGDVERAESCPDCVPGQRVPCLGLFGVGTRACDSARCDRYVSCWGVLDTGEIATGTLAAHCGSDCFDAQVRALDVPTCARVTCAEAPPCGDGFVSHCIEYGSSSVATTTCVAVVESAPAGVADLVWVASAAIVCGAMIALWVT